LDSNNGRLVLDLLLKRNREEGTTLVLVTHDAEIASQADRKIVLKDGLILEDTLQRTEPTAVASAEHQFNG
jgi:putative ABC transport system ATP-binding protein